MERKAQCEGSLSIPLVNGQRVATGKWRAGDSGGSSRFLGLRLRAETRIPTPEGVLPLQRRRNLLHHLAVQVSSQFSRLGNQIPVTAED